MYVNQYIWNFGAYFLLTCHGLLQQYLKQFEAYQGTDGLLREWLSTCGARSNDSSGLFKQTFETGGALKK